MTISVITGSNQNGDTVTIVGTLCLTCTDGEKLPRLRLVEACPPRG